ncbi:helix-turn-helix domain-containing protein [Streptomyces acidiscabies]|uniref:CdaR family transcriptional regulator n=1 Tax=Streptomyces acidiscabies TaxID=42234 RepID=A0A0L0JWN5_9ACTN|nr:helix-turn-helix domain-containing protein [Streptomyces acidiscabies]KND29943.1 CdaR family transcriptional regulator [Streptomyces acidiscabies]
MKELAGRLSAVDPVAGAAVGVIAYFDRLAEARAGVEALVRGAAVLAGVPVRLVDEERRVRVRVEADGVRRDDDTPPDPAWPSAPLTPGGRPALWLERGGGPPGGGTGGLPDVGANDSPDADTTSSPRVGANRSPGNPTAAPPSVVDAVILERAAGAVSRVLDRTRGRAPSDDPALMETLLDAGAPEQARLHAARRLGLAPGVRARVVVPLDGAPYVVPVPASQESRPVLASRAGEGPVPVRAGESTAGIRTAGIRAGVGPSLPLLSLPDSWAAARTALRFTAEDTAADPGPRVVYADDLGGVALLAETVVPGGEPPPDVRALERAAVEAPWMLATLHAVAFTQSLRAAATELTVHHSTLQDRLAHTEQSLGWPVRTPQGRFRLQLALTMRRLVRP